MPVATPDDLEDTSMPVAFDMYTELGAREDGTYANLWDGDEDATGNSQATRVGAVP